MADKIDDDAGSVGSKGSKRSVGSKAQSATSDEKKQVNYDYCYYYDHNRYHNHDYR